MVQAMMGRSSGSQAQGPNDYCYRHHDDYRGHSHHDGWVSPRTPITTAPTACSPLAHLNSIMILHRVPVTAVHHHQPASVTPHQPWAWPAHPDRCLLCPLVPRTHCSPTLRLVPHAHCHPSTPPFLYLDYLLILLLIHSISLHRSQLMHSAVHQMVTLGCHHTLTCLLQPNNTPSYSVSCSLLSRNPNCLANNFL